MGKQKLNPTTVPELEKTVVVIKSSKATGMDGIPAKAMKKLSEQTENESWAC